MFISLPTTPILCSEDMGWSGIQVEEYLLSPNEIALAPLSEHVFCLNLGQSLQLLREYDGCVREALSNTGSLSLIPAGVPSRWAWNQVANILLLRLETTFISKVAIEMGWRGSNRIEITNQCGTYDSQVWHLALLFQAELKQSSSGTRLYGDSLATALAVHLLHHYSSFPQTVQLSNTRLPKAVIRRVVEYIQENLTENLSLENLSALVDISPNYFVSLFKQSMGLTPHQYIVCCRVERAKQLLQQRQDLTIAQIADCVGFADQSHLCRQMRRVLGVTPKQVRQGL